MTASSGIGGSASQQADFARVCSTALLADAMDQLGLSGFALDRAVSSLLPGARLAGPALCVQGRRLSGNRSGRSLYCDIDRAITSGCVVVVDTGEYDEAAVVGGNAAIAFHRRGAAGLVVDGVARDVDEFVELNFPCFCRGTSVLGFPTRWDYTAVDTPIAVRASGTGSVQLVTGDFVVGDTDGVVVIPAAHLGAVAERAAKLEQKQAFIKQQLLTGADRATVYQMHAH